MKKTPTTVILDRARYRLSTVLTSLISHERRLTQRIVELARDPLSYFGNLVSTLKEKEPHLFWISLGNTISQTCKIQMGLRLTFIFLHLGKRASCIHPGDHVEPLLLHWAVTGDQTDGDAAEELPAAEYRAASHAGATASVCTRQTG